MADGIRFPIARLPGGMTTARPRLNIEPGKMAWVENYSLSRGAYHTRAGFEKLNSEAIPKSGLRFDGSARYVSITKPEDLNNDFNIGNSTNCIIDVSFILEDFPETDGAIQWLYTASTTGTTDLGLGVVRTGGLIQLRLLAGGTSQNSALALEDSIKPGVGYRFVVLKDTLTGPVAWRINVFRQGAGSIYSAVVLVANPSTSTRLFTIGRSLEVGSENYFKGIIQEFRYYKYPNDAGGATTMLATDGWIMDSDDDLPRARYDHELSDAEIAEQYLKCYLRMDDVTDDRLVDLSGEGNDGYIRPGPPSWVVGGLVDNAPTTYAVKLDDRQGHHVKALDRPVALGVSVFDQVRLNTALECTVSFAFELDAVRIAELEAASAAPDIIALYYFGDAGGGLGRDIQAAGEWALALELENAGIASASQYRIKFKLVDSSNLRTVGLTALHDVVPGSRYRMDFTRNEGRYLYARLYKDGEKFSAATGEELRFDLGAAVGARTLYSGAFTNGGVMLFGTLLDLGTQRYFPGKIDDIRIFWKNAEKAATEYNITQHPWDKVEGYDSTLVLHLLLNEGTGVYVADASTFNNNQATALGPVGELHTLEPSSLEPPDLGVGWVKANRFNRSAGLFGFKDIQTEQETILSVVGGAIWGCPANFDASEVRFTPLWHGLKGNEPMQMVHVNNQAIFSDGLNDTLRYDGKSIGELGIPAPANAPAVADAGGVSPGILVGTYLYCYTWRNSKTGGRSNPSPTATITVATNDRAHNVRPYTPPDGTDYLCVDEIEIWRTQAGGTRFYKIGTMKIPNREGVIAVGVAGPSGTVMAPFGDTTRDANIGTTLLFGGANTTRFTRLPKCRFIVSGRGRLVGVGTPGNPNRIVWCELNFPDHHDPQRQFSDDMDSGNGDKATGAVYVNGKIYFFQRRSVWVMRGIESEDTIRLDQAFSGIGCVDQSTIEVKGGTLLFRGEDNWYAFDVGSQAPVPIGNDVRNMLELVNPPDDRTGTSAILEKESTYLCALTSITGKAINANTRNDFILAFALDTGQWSVWTIPSLGYLRNIELGGRSDLYALMRTGFLYRYSGRGQDVASGVSLLLTYTDGLSRGKRTAFTLAATVSDGDTWIEVNEDDTDDAFVLNDGMKGSTLRWLKEDGSLSAVHLIRFVRAVAGGGLRFYLNGVVAESGATTRMGAELHVGGYTRRLLSPDLDMGDFTQDKTVAGVSLAAEGSGSAPLRPMRAPQIPAADVGTTYGYAYTYKTDEAESRLSEIVSTTATTVQLTMEAPGTEIGDNPKIHVYRIEWGVTVWELLTAIDVSAIEDPGKGIVYSDAGGAVTTAYDADNSASELLMTVQTRDRQRGYRTQSSFDKKRIDLAGPDVYAESVRATGSVFNLDIESWVPGGDHVIEAITALYEWGIGGGQ